MHVRMDASLNSLAGEAVVAGRPIQTVERLRDSHRRVAQRIGRRAVQNHRVVQLAATSSVGE